MLATRQAAETARLNAGTTAQDLLFSEATVAPCSRRSADDDVSSARIDGIQQLRPLKWFLLTRTEYGDEWWKRHKKRTAHLRATDNLSCMPRRELVLRQSPT